MTYPIGTLFNLANTRLNLKKIRRIEKVEIFDINVSYAITYPFNNNSNILFRYYGWEIRPEDILTEEEIIKLNKLLTFQ